MQRERAGEGGSPQSQLTTYFREIDRAPLLTAEEERALAVRIQEGDQVARDQMARANLRLVVKIARSYLGRGVSPEDLIEEGNLGLLRAVEGFDPSMHTRFSTYASHWIRQSIIRTVVLNLVRKATRVLTAADRHLVQEEEGEGQPGQPVRGGPMKCAALLAWLPLPAFEPWTWGFCTSPWRTKGPMARAAASADGDRRNLPCP